MKRSNLIALELRLSKTVWDAVYEAEDVDDKVSIFNGVVTQALDGSHSHGLMLLTIRVVIKQASMPSLSTLKKPLI